jgi:hypothetical protein
MERPDRTARLHVLMSKEERQTLEDLAANEGVSASVIVRRLVRDAHRKLCAAP